KASEKALKRLWEAYEVLKELVIENKTNTPQDAALEEKVTTWCKECAEFMNDDLNTAKVIANLFELVPVINGMKGGQIAKSALADSTLELLKATFKTYLEDIFGLQPVHHQDNEVLDKVMSLLIEIRKDARSRKDFATSDQIRNELAKAGVQLKDEKDGSVSYTIE